VSNGKEIEIGDNLGCVLIVALLVIGGCVFGWVFFR
jgi:hypothetical protein